MSNVKRKIKRIIRHRRVRSTIRGTGSRPRLSVYRSNKNVVLQLIDDDAGKTLIATSTQTKGSKKVTKSDRAFDAGKRLATKAKEQGITKVVFDRGGFRYHGRIARVAEGAREGGLNF